MRIFLDTDVLFDLYARRTPFFEDAERLMLMEMVGDAELWVTSESFTVIFYVMRKSVPAGSIQNAFGKSLEFLNVCSTNSDDILAATESAWPDFEDCLIDICARKVKADYLLTRDADGFVRSDTPHPTPSEFFAILETRYGVTYETVAC